MIKCFFILINLFVYLNVYAVNDQEIKVGISASPSNLNPFYSVDSNSQNINRMLHVSLVEINEQMQVVCSLCQSFDERIETNKHIIHFTLKKEFTFSDGSPVQAINIYNSWKFFAKDEKIKSTLMGSFELIEDVKILDPFNVELVYKKFSLENLTNLTLLKIVKIKNVDHSKLSVFDIVGAGDFVIKNIGPLEIIIAPRKKTGRRFVFKVVKDETTLALKLINHEIDLSVASLSPRKVEWLKNKSNELQVWDLPSSNYLYLAMNFKNELVRDRRFRMGLSYLIPREKLLKFKLKNTAILSNGMFSPAFKEMYKAGGIEPFDPIMARKLFNEMGIVKNNEGKLIYNHRPIVLDWKVNNNKASLEMVEIIKNHFEKEGIVVNMLVQEWGTFMNSYTSGNFDLLIGQWMGFTGPNMLDFVFNSKNIPPNGGNRIGYNNPKFDKTIDLALTEQSKNKRNILFKEAYKIINDDHVYINLWHPNIIWIGSKCLKNVELEPTGSFINLPKVELNCEK